MIYFQNPGVADLRALTVMGVNVKTGSAIGFFGTGFKYAVATILRNGGSVSAWLNGVECKFGTATEVIRGEPHDIVTLNDEPLGFTTKMGKTWEDWMALRELACNAWDEGGSMTDKEPSGGVQAASVGCTIICVDDPGVESAYRDRNLYLIEPERERTVLSECEVLPGTSTKIFYKGVAVASLDRPSAKTYNVTRKIDLTEDRTARWAFQARDAVIRSIIACDDRDLIYDALNAGDQAMEGSFDWAGCGSDPSETWLDVVDEMAGQGRVPVGSVASVYHTHRKISEASHYGVELTAAQRAMYEEATGFLARAGYDVTSAEIIFVEKIDSDGTLAMAKSGRSYISQECFDQGLDMLIHALFEEWVHISTGYSDHTRSLQTWLFRQVIHQARRADQE